MGKSELLENSAIKLRTLWNNMIIAVDHAEMDFQFVLAPRESDDYYTDYQSDETDNHFDY